MLKLLPLVQKSSCVLKLAMLLLILVSMADYGLAQCSNPSNPVVAENCLTGNDSGEWDVNNGDGGDPTIQGFTTDMSVNQGGTINFKISTPVSAYSINIYRIGYYGGKGARKVATITPSAPLPQIQPACLGDSTTGLTDCGNWAVSASWQVPTTAVSGVYIAHLVRSDTGGDSHIVFIVRNDSSRSDIVYQTSDTTWQAYNYYGNGSLYGPGQPFFGLSVRSFAVSYNRPVLTRGFNNESATFLFGAEFAMIQWLESNGYDVSYMSGVDTARSGSLIKNHKIFMDSGHDEYVSAQARTSMEAARDAGVNMAFFSGNEVFWKTRWSNSIDGTNTAFRTIVCYKETLAFAKLDPLDPPTWTGTWRDPTFSPPGDGGKPENALTGTLFVINGTGDDNPGDQTIKVPAEDGKMRFWRNTAAATLAPGTSYTLVPGSLGYEWDIDADNGFRPAGAFRLSTTTYNFNTDLLLDYGATYGAGSATHHLMTYRAPSGALVFGAGTIDWAYGLNSNHDNSFDLPNNPAPDVNMQQATVNLLADMSAQPATLQAGLRLATKSTDVVPPHSSILSPATGANISTGNTISVTGIANDTGGVVAGVEVSGDGGATWHPASGRSNWTYSWAPTVAGSTTLLSRAVDDTGNIETPSGGIILSVAPQTCPCTIFGSNAPAAPDSGDNNAVELGVKFRADADGSIVGVRFYKAATNVGTHLGHLWSSSGQLLGSATFSGETGSGWQQVNFGTPIPATANTTYVASYFAPSGHYSADSFYFQQAGVDNPPLHALANGVDGGNGSFVYSNGGGFPNSTSNSSNYWVDVIYASSNTYSISGNISGAGGAGAIVSLIGPENLSTSSDGLGNYTFDGVVNGSYTVSVSSPGVTFAPSSQSVSVNFGVATNVNFVATVTNPLSISGSIMGGAGATVSLAGPTNTTTTADSSGNYSFGGLLSGTYSVTPSQATYIFVPSTQVVTLSGSNATNVNFEGQVCTCISIWQPSETPAVIDSGDGNSVELGVKFTADSAAYLTGLRFYKSSSNIGTHVGHLWSSSGQLIATASFPGETASGWQQGYFSSPVLVNAGTTYIASYLAPKGHYSVSGAYFASSGVDRPPLHALASGVSGGNGVFTYTATGAFPNQNYNASNYWVDILYAAQPHNITGSVTTAGTGTGVAGVTVSLGGVSQATTTTDASGNFAFTGVYGGSYSITPSGAGYVFIPGNQNVSISQADVNGVNFTVPQICPCNTVWQSSVQPTKVDGLDPQAVETGTKIRADADGYILGVRFYKAATNTGVHIGNLWSSGAGTGTLLSSSTFANEGASGWQQVLFANPVPVVANKTYVASYFAPMGHYSADSAYFANGVDSPPLHALQNGVDGQNGVFSYGATSTYPSDSFNQDNYWVDVIYASAPTHTIAGVVSGPGASGATITLSGPTNATTTSDANGAFTFNGVVDGSYTLTATESGFVFGPASQTFAINGAHHLSANFSSSILGYAVSGTVAGAPGITVTIAGVTTQTTVADSSGNYSFATVPSGTYTVTPAGLGFAVNPTSQNVIVNGSDLSNVKFSSTVTLFSISGSISGGAGATVSLAGPSTSITTIADATGNYTFAGISVGSYVVSPLITPGVVFNPGNQTVVLNGTNATGVNFVVPQNCPCDTIWPASATPALIDSGDTNSVELGVKFRADADAYITGLRFFKASTSTGTHVGHIWTSSGTLLGTATFTNESNSGWQQVLFSSLIPVVANTTYVASYFAPAGRYSADLLYFAAAGVDTPPLHALGNGVDGANGVYVYTSVGGFPSINSQNAVNYWVDVIYAPSTTYSVAGAIAGTGGPGATVTLSGASSSTVTADPSGNFAFNGLSNGTYVVTPSASGSTYSPISQSATIANGHFLGVSFSSSAALFSLTGTISGVGGPGATVSLSGSSTATTVADGTGAFTFTGITNGAYTVAVSQNGFVYTPASQSLTINGVNAAVTVASTTSTFSLSGTIGGPGGNGATVILSGASSATTTADASGAFSFAAVANGSYTVAVNKTGYVFTPPSQAVTISGANATATFSSVVQTFSILGTISGAGGNGATVSLAGTSTATTTANASGGFSFPGLANGAYTVAVSNVGFVFTPASQSVTVNAANANVSISSIVQTFSLTGTISGTGGNGAIVTVSGTSTASATANASGVYSFPALPRGSYTVTPAKAGFLYTPASAAVTLTANSTANFSSAPSFSISGTISGAGGSGATVLVTGTATVTATANASGVYSVTGLPRGTYIVTPSKSGGTYVYTPASQNVTINASNVTANFSSVQRYSITGTISGSGGNGATVRLTGTSSATVTANASGVYTFSGLATGSYTVAASKTGYTFTPTSQAVSITNANATVNFSSAVQTFTISGTISGAGGNGATVKLAGVATATVTASASGVYSFTGLVAGAYTVTLSKTGYVYTPGSQSVTISTANVTTNFSSAVQTFTITGTITGTGSSGATVRLTGAASTSTTTSSSGTYTFTGLVNGAYTVTASKTGYVYTPASQAVTLSGANAVANFSSVTQTYSITGTISGAGGSGATVTLGGAASATVTANSSGVYTFTGLANGIYAVTPRKSGRTFTPSSQITFVSSANVTGLNFSSR